jgi:hypothetical protein
MKPMGAFVRINGACIDGRSDETGCGGVAAADLRTDHLLAKRVSAASGALRQRCFQG